MIIIVLCTAEEQGLVTSDCSRPAPQEAYQSQHPLVITVEVILGLAASSNQYRMSTQPYLAGIVVFAYKD